MYNNAETVIHNYGERDLAVKMESEEIQRPLQQISSNHINQMRIPQSPSLPAHLSENVDPQFKRRDSDICVSADVRSKIALLNSKANSQNSNVGSAGASFAIASSPTRSPVRPTFGSPSKTHSRANSTIPLPSDQSELVSLVQALQAQLEQSRNRERLVAERVESMMEQLTTAHSRARHEKQIYEKEIKALNRGQYKSELALIKSQEELREARSEQEAFKVRAEHERQAKDKSRQEAFERARTLASNVEELEVVKRERDVLQTENDALKALQNSLSIAPQENHQPEMKEVGVQVEISLPTPREEIAYAHQNHADIADFIENKSNEIQELHDELTWVKSQLKREQDLVHFMNMQCQFRACSCRQAEKAGVRFVHDHEYDQRQQLLSTAKGLKRRAEDELPLPSYISVKRIFSSDKGRSSVQRFPQAEESQNSAVVLSQGQGQVKEEAADTQMEDNDTLRTLSENTAAIDSNLAGVVALEEAADIPLPSPRSDDLEPTAILEDMTQVMVEPEPAATSKHFAFSTSISSRRPLELETPLLCQSHSAIPANSVDDLFDMAPPRHHLPPRPSTVMGIRTTDSPIRMVPPSPQHTGSLTPTASPPRFRSIQVPLKGEMSPFRSVNVQRRSHSRPGERTRVRSPTPRHATLDSTSPSASTYFPVTPKTKTERQQRQVQLMSHSHLQQLQNQSSITTMVPLRGLEDDDVFSPEKPFSTHTQPISAEEMSKVRGRSVDSVAQQPNVMLPGTPISREAALAQIRARRDRAKSENMRRMKKSEDDDGTRVQTPRSVARRGVVLNRDGQGGRDISNLSQASAPARF